MRLSSGLSVVAGVGVLDALRDGNGERSATSPSADKHARLTE